MVVLTLNSLLLAKIASIVLPLLFILSYGRNNVRIIRCIAFVVWHARKGIFRGLSLGGGIFAIGYLICLKCYGCFVLFEKAAPSGYHVNDIFRGGVAWVWILSVLALFGCLVDPIVRATDELNPSIKTT